MAQKKLPAPPVLEKEMSFIDHLEELRWHIIRSLVAVSIVMVAVFIGKNFVFDTIILGPKKPNFLTYTTLCKLSNWLNLGDSMCMKPYDFQIISVDMGGQFWAHLQISMILGLIVAMPYILWELWRFIKPGLMPTEVKQTQGIVFVTSILFFAGVAFGYYILCPFSINFLASYAVSSEVKNTISLGSYVENLSGMILASGLSFEMPMLVFFLSKIGLITADFMRSYRRHALVIILFIAAIITPSPDIMSQLIVSIPLYMLYEMSIFVALKEEQNNTE